jgi:hypothetical protein
LEGSGTPPYRPGMTTWLDVSDLTPRVAYTAEAAQTDFVVPFQFVENGDILVYVDAVLQTITTDYTLTGAQDEDGGTVAFVSGRSAGEIILIVRELPIELTTHVPLAGPLDIPGINLMFSRVVMLIQQIDGNRIRSLRQPTSDTADIAELPTAAERAGNYLGFDADGDPVALSSVSTAVAATPFWEGVISNSTTAAEAREDLGIEIGTVTAADRTALKAIDPADFLAVTLRESGREGLFVWKAGDYSTFVASDPEEGVYIESDDVAATSGAWVRTDVGGIYKATWFGAVADNLDASATANTAAIQAAIDLAGDLAGGTVQLNGGGFTVNDDISIDTALTKLEGIGNRHTSLRFTVANKGVIITAARCGLKNLSIFSLMLGTSASALVTLGNLAGQCTVEDLDLVGGFYCIRAIGTSSDNIIHNVVARLSNGGAILYTQGTGALYVDRCTFNQDWPVSVPATDGTNDQGVHATSTSYDVGDFVTLDGYYLQCATAGISDGSAPDITGVWYGEVITDGAAEWYIAGNASGDSILVDTASTYIDVMRTDMTGAFQNSFAVRNNLAGVEADEIRVERCTMAGTVATGINANNVARLIAHNNEIQACVGGSGTTAGIYVQSGVTGEVTMSKNRIVAGFAYGILDDHAAGGITLMESNQIFGLALAIGVLADVTHFTIVHNLVGDSAKWGPNTTAIDVATGASDWYTIVNNKVNGAGSGVVDNGSGSNKTVTPNH